MCAPNGARKTKSDHPELPIAPVDLAACARSIREAGASIMHTHVRDASGQHTLDVDTYRSALQAIRAAVEDSLVIQVTTEACGIYSAAQQMQMVRELRPEAVSVALGEICPDARSETIAAEFYGWMASERIMAQHILYSPDDVRRFESMRSRGVIPDRKPFVLFVLGRYSAELEGNVADLPQYIEAVNDDTSWAVCSFGATELKAANAAAEQGGHIRVGFENNLQLPNGRIAPDNAALVDVAVSAGLTARRQPATADDVRSAFA